MLTSAAAAIRRRQHLPIVLIIAGDIGAHRLEPELRRFSADADSEVATAAQHGLRILAAQRGPSADRPGSSGQ